MDNFRKKYAGVYDVLYREKDYEGECDLLERIFKKYGLTGSASVLDLGCGTGRHSVILTRRGYRVTGIDLSEEMLVIAGDRARKEKLDICFQRADIKGFNLTQKFDAAIAMFAVMGYQTSNEDLTNSLENVRRHLKPGGLFVFDAWFGPGVLVQEPKNPVKIIRRGKDKLIRKTNAKLDLMNQTVEVAFEVTRARDGKAVEKTKELHLIRFFFPQEITYFLNQAGFKVEQMSPFPDTGSRLSEKEWNMLVIGRVRNE